jgi:hypothetical protein
MTKAPAEIRSLARSFAKRAIQRLGGIVENSADEQAVARAASILLDRGYGKPNQPITGEDGGDITVVLRTITEGFKKK